MFLVRVATVFLQLAPPPPPQQQQSVASQHVGKPINREEGHHRKQHFAHHDTSRLDAHTDRTVAAVPDINNKRVTTQRLFSYCCCYVARCSNRWWSIVLPCGKKAGESISTARSARQKSAQEAESLPRDDTSSLTQKFGQKQEVDHDRQV